MHIGLIPDGNRRFMLKKHIHNLMSSYDMGINKFYDFLKWSNDFGADEVTIYALSLENIKTRGNLEIENLYKVFSKHALKGVGDEEIHKRKIRVRVCGDKDYIINEGPMRDIGKKMIDDLEKLEEATKDYDGFTLNLAIAYGGRQEIVNACRKLVEKGEEITEEGIQENLWVKNDPDIIIRTSEERISNFLLWQAAYSEIYFVEKLWQEFEKPDLEKIINNFKDRERRFGR